MSNKIVTHVITSPSQTYSYTTLSDDLSLYQGFLYYIAGTGSEGEDVTYFDSNGDLVGTYSYGGSSGFVNSGYIDLEYPYIVDSVSIELNPGSTGLGATNLIINYTPDSSRPDPTNGGGPVIIKADAGGVYPYNKSTTSTTSFDLSVVGFYQGANNNISSAVDVKNQRGHIINGNGATGQLTSDFGVSSSSVYGGGGFYGGTVLESGSTGPFGFSSGNINTISSSGNIGYAVISLIPKNIIGSTGFYISNDSITDSGLYLYSLLGGGGGGGGGYSNEPVCNGGGGGGGGSFKSGFKYITSLSSITIGYGGNGGQGQIPNPQPGNDGGDTVITNLSSSETIVASGGFGGGANSTGVANGSGGPGYYGGGQGCSSTTISSSNPAIQTDGFSLLSIPSYYGKGYAVFTDNGNGNSSNGGGFVNYSGARYGQGRGNGDVEEGFKTNNAGGGGGGWYGGNGGYNTRTEDESVAADNAVGYGSGGGGGAGFINSFPSSDGSNGSQGYAIIHKITDLTSINMVTLSIPSTLYPTYFLPYKGFWFFLDGNDGVTGLNSGHFLIKEDNVRSIQVSLSGTFFTITVTFSRLFGKTQTFNMVATSPQPYMNILFYM